MMLFRFLSVHAPPRPAVQLTCSRLFYTKSTKTIYKTQKLKKKEKGKEIVPTPGQPAPRHLPLKQQKIPGKLLRNFDWAKRNKWKIVSDGDEGLPSVKAVPKDENQMTPFQFSVTRLFNALKVKSIGDWSKETKSRNVTIGIIESLPTKTIHDIYYDTHDRRMLSKRALVRKRNDKWSAWVRLHNNSLQHQVWTSSKDVGDLVHSRSYVLSKKLNPRKPDILIWPAWQRANWGLHPLAEYTFERQHWKVHCNVGNYGEAIFDVYWDKSDFGYEGGEVEFVKSIPKKTQTNEWKKQTAENAENAIIRFMKALPHVFDIGSHNYKQWPMGILRAYMEKYPGGWGEQQGLPPVDLTDEESQESQEYEKRPFIIRRIPSGPRPEIDHFKTIPWEGTLEEWMPSITTPEVNKTNFRNMLQSEPLGESVSASRTVDARHTVRAAVEVVEEEDDEQDPFQILETEKR